MRKNIPRKEGEILSISINNVPGFVAVNANKIKIIQYNAMRLHINSLSFLQLAGFFIITLSSFCRTYRVGSLDGEVSLVTS